jgi:hypothetical protein
MQKLQCKIVLQLKPKIYPDMFGGGGGCGGGGGGGGDDNHSS